MDDLTRRSLFGLFGVLVATPLITKATEAAGGTPFLRLDWKPTPEARHYVIDLESKYDKRKIYATESPYIEQVKSNQVYTVNVRAVMYDLSTPPSQSKYEETTIDTSTIKEIQAHDVYLSFYRI